jgi:hypothetical protein
MRIKNCPDNWQWFGAISDTHKTPGLMPSFIDQLDGPTEKLLPHT